MLELFRTKVFCRLKGSCSKSSKLPREGMTPGSEKAVKIPKSNVKAVHKTPMIKAQIFRPQFSKSTSVVPALKHWATKNAINVSIAFQG
jgi:hypothetical protein